MLLDLNEINYWYVSLNLKLIFLFINIDNLPNNVPLSMFPSAQKSIVYKSYLATYNTKSTVYSSNAQIACLRKILSMSKSKQNNQLFAINETHIDLNVV